MKKKEFIQSINDLNTKYVADARSLLSSLDDINEIIREVDSDLKEGLKGVKCTMHANSSRNDYSITLYIRLKSGTKRFGMDKSMLMTLAKSNAGASPNTWIMRQMIDTLWSSRVDQHADVSSAMERAGAKTNMHDWLWSRLDIERAAQICWEALMKASEQDFDEAKAQQKHEKRIALRRLKKNLLFAAKAYHVEYSSGGRKVIRAKLPPRDQVIQLVQDPPGRDDNLRRVVDGSSWRRPTPSSWKNFSGREVCIFVNRYLYQISSDNYKVAQTDYKPTTDDINKIYDYLVAKEIIES